MNARRTKNVTALCLIAFAASACAAMTPTGDTVSPIDARIRAAVDANRTYPQWADFPAAPRDLPTPTQLAQRVNTLQATRGALAGEVSRLEWDITSAGELEQALTDRITVVPPSPTGLQTQAEIDAFAERLRRRATPPPPVVRPPRP